MLGRQWNYLLLKSKLINVYNGMAIVLLCFCTGHNYQVRHSILEEGLGTETSQRMWVIAETVVNSYCIQKMFIGNLSIWFKSKQYIAVNISCSIITHSNFSKIITIIQLCTGKHDDVIKWKHFSGWWFEMSSCSLWCHWDMWVLSVLDLCSTIFITMLSVCDILLKCTMFYLELTVFR